MELTGGAVCDCLLPTQYHAFAGWKEVCMRGCCWGCSVDGLPIASQLAGCLEEEEEKEEAAAQLCPAS